MSYRLYFNAREWSFNKDCPKNVGERCFINDLENDKLVEVYTIGNWNWDWTEIITKPMILDQYSEYQISFWINGGENDRNDEVCQFRVIYNNDHENPLVYKLNRSFIKPLKRYKGWELYNITFDTLDYESIQLNFVAMRAYMTIMPAKEPDYYKDWENVLDPYDELRPQRHNLIFEDGWPTNTWYSTNELKNRKSNSSGSNWSQAKEWGKQMAKDVKGKVSEFHMPEIHIPEIHIPDITFPKKDRHKSHMPSGDETMKDSQEKGFETSSEQSSDENGSVHYDSNDNNEKTSDGNGSDHYESNDRREQSENESTDDARQDDDNIHMDFVDDLLNQIKEAIQVDKIVDEIKSSFHVDEMADQIKNSFKTTTEFHGKSSIDPEKLANEIKESILSHFKSES